MIKLSGKYIRKNECQWDYICRLINESIQIITKEEDEEL